MSECCEVEVIEKTTGRRVEIGDTVISFRDEPATFQGVSRGPLPGKSARVLVTWDADDPSDSRNLREYYCSVFGLDVIPV